MLSGICIAVFARLLIFFRVITNSLVGSTFLVVTILTITFLKKWNFSFKIVEVISRRIRNSFSKTICFNFHKMLLDVCLSSTNH